MIRILVSAAAALSLTACAAFQAHPTSATCSTSRNQLAAAQISLDAADAGLQAAQAAGDTGVVLATFQATAAAAQVEVTLFTNAVNANCAAPAPVIAVSTPVVSASVRLGG